MRSFFTTLFIATLAWGVFAQAPQKMTYQSIIRDGFNDLIAETVVGMEISIVQGSVAGPAIFVESHTPTSNINGLITIEIGTGIASFGDFTSIDWTDGPYFIKTGIDPLAGTNYTIEGISQLLSVPYALYAEKSGSSLPGPTGPMGITGPYGVTGEQGVTGPQGIQGETGPQGEQGDQGISGPTGATGINGQDGVTGPQGTTGPTGPQGEQGVTGPQGIQGETGPFGPQGTTGAQGATGPSGPAGPTGPPGNSSFVGCLYAGNSIMVSDGDYGYNIFFLDSDEYVYDYDGSGANAPFLTYNVDYNYPFDGYYTVPKKGIYQITFRAQIDYLFLPEGGTIDCLVSVNGSSIDIPIDRLEFSWAEAGEPLWLRGTHTLHFTAEMILNEDQILRLMLFRFGAATIEGLNGASFSATLLHELP